MKKKMHRPWQTSFRGDPLAVIADANNCTYRAGYPIILISYIADATSEFIISYEDLTAFDFYPVARD